MRQAYTSTDDPEKRMVRIATSYCDFAWDNKELYQVMFGMGGAAHRAGAPPPELAEMSHLLLDAARTALHITTSKEKDLQSALDIPLPPLYMGWYRLVWKAISMAAGSERVASRSKLTRMWLLAEQATSK